MSPAMRNGPRQRVLPLGVGPSPLKPPIPSPTIVTTFRLSSILKIDSSVVSVTSRAFLRSIEIPTGADRVGGPTSVATELAGTEVTPKLAAPEVTLRARTRPVACSVVKMRPG